MLECLLMPALAARDRGRGVEGVPEEDWVAELLSRVDGPFDVKLRRRVVTEARAGPGEATVGAGQRFQVAEPGGGNGGDRPSCRVLLVGRVRDVAATSRTR